MLNRLSRTVLTYPIQVLLGILLLTGYFFWYAFLSEDQLIVDFSMEQMFPDEDPEKDIYQQFLKEFSREDDIFLLAYKCENPLNRENIELVSELTEEMEFVDGVESVLSLGNLEPSTFLDYDLPDADWEQQTKSLLDHPIYHNLLISENGDVGAILVNLEDDVVGQDARKTVIAKIDQILFKTDWEWHEAGIPILRTRYIEFVNRERSIFLPISFLVVAIVLLMVFRQIKGILIPLAAISATLIWVAAFMASLGISINVVSYLTFNLLMVIGVADAIHLLVKYHEGLSMGLSRKDALDMVIKDIGSALFLTSFTTAVGFMSLMFTNIRVTQEFGFVLGCGVVLMFLLTIIIMPVLLSLIKIPDEDHIRRLIRGGRFQAAETLGNWTKSHQKVILTASGVIFIVTLIGLFKMDYNATILDDLKPGNSLYDDVMFVEEHFGGTLPLEVVVDTRRPDGALDPETLNKVHRFKESIREMDNVGQINAVTDYLMLINEELGNGGRKLPATRAEVQSFIIDNEYAGRLLNSDNSKARISGRIANITIEEAKILKSSIIESANAIFADEVDVIITGSTLLALRTSLHLVKSLTTSFIIAFTIIFISMVFLFRSFRLALLAILPNVIPLMVAGGLMGYLGIKLRPSTAMTFSIALGIAVDDTIHFLARFRQEFLKSGDYEESIRKTLLTTGKAIISTTIILSLGFIVLYFSEFVPNHEFGILATIILIFALGGSIILLPVLILQIRPGFRFRLDFSKLKK